MRILALDAALGRCSAAVVGDGKLVAARSADTERDHAAALPPMVADILAEAGLRTSDLDAIAVTVGPGGFTSLRAAIALGYGLSLGSGRPLIGVSVGEAFAQALPRLGGRTLWAAIVSRGERIFLERPDRVLAANLPDIEDPGHPVALAGNAAIEVTARLAARGADVMLTDLRVPRPQDVAAVASLRLRGLLPPRSPMPIYAEPPAAKPRAGERPPPS